jgi:transcriptional regulator with XRE-family HTH domain
VVVFMTPDDNVIYHTHQAETSHSRPVVRCCTLLPMQESKLFRDNLLQLMAEKDLSAAALSRAAGLNPRAVKDIEEGRVASPKLSTVFALARALGADPGEMLGLGSRLKIQADLAEYLSQYSEEDQERLLQAFRAIQETRYAG